MLAAMMRRKQVGGRPGTQTGPEAMVSGPSRAEVRAAIEGLPQDMSWTSLADSLMPVFIRRRPMPPGTGRPVTTRRPPGLEVAVAVDIGPAFLYVSEPWLDEWSVTFDTAIDRAMANLHARVTAEACVEMQYETIAGIPFWWHQSEHGLASGLLLLQDELVRRYGDEPRLLIAPMRNLLIAAPFDADRELVAWVRDEVASEDPNGLDLPILALVEGRLSFDTRGMQLRRASVH